MSEHLPMFSSIAFALHHRRNLHAGKDLAFLKCSFQRGQNTGYRTVVSCSILQPLQAFADVVAQLSL